VLAEPEKYSNIKSDLMKVFSNEFQIKLTLNEMNILSADKKCQAS
jgi:hypothetical protein